MVDHNEKSDILDWLEENKPRFTYMADRIWERPEILWQEKFAANLQAGFLENEGFMVERGTAGMETAFVAEWGEGKPVIGFIGEYDALPGLSQKAQPVKEAIESNGAGHGCGHNLLGTAALAGTVAVQKWLERTQTKGTVRYYGCPAEEGGGGKVFMAKAGVFDDLDAALTWHPGSLNMPGKASTVAILSSEFHFRGTAAHAGMAPHLGRSALDAVELMNVGANYLREHVTDDVRIQYVITNGGQAANIVPETAAVSYILRAAKPEYLKKVHERIQKIAEGAASMTETEFEEVIGTSYVNLKPNHYIADLIFDALETIGPIEFSDDEYQYAQAINETYPGTPDEIYAMLIERYKPTEDIIQRLEPEKEKPLMAINMPSLNAGKIFGGATDVGDLSQVTPTGVLYTACFTTKSPGHSWANVATGGMSIGHKGMMHAAKALALTGLELVVDPIHIESARAEFDRMMDGRRYESLQSDAVQPPKSLD